MEIQHLLRITPSGWFIIRPGVLYSNIARYTEAVPQIDGHLGVI